jgi:hypothetical protein
LMREIESHPDEPEYHADLRILRRFVYNGSFGYRASNDGVFQRLKTRYPEAYYASARSGSGRFWSGTNVRPTSRSSAGLIRTTQIRTSILQPLSG